MTADRRSQKRGLYQAVCLLAALAVALSARPAAATAITGAPQAGAEDVSAGIPDTTPLGNPVRTRIEGVVRSISGDTWLVDTFTVKLSPATVIQVTRGAAAVGAYVLVKGLQYLDHVDAQLIEVRSPAGSPPPVYQYTGPLNKIRPQFWVVGETAIFIPPTLPIPAGAVLGALVRVTVQRSGNELVAIEIQVIAANPESVPFAIKGEVQQITDDNWVVDNTTVNVPATLNVFAEQGDLVEIEAVVSGGKLVARQARVVDRSQEATFVGYVSSVDGLGQDNQTWTVLSFDGNRATPQKVRVTPQTYVDEDRAVTEVGLEAAVQGDQSGSGQVDAALVTLAQPVPATAAGTLSLAADDTLSRVGGQPVWFASDELKQSAVAVAGMKAAAVAENAGESIAVRGVQLSNGVLIAQEIIDGAAAAAAFAAEAADGQYSADWLGPNDVNPALEKANKPTVLYDRSGNGYAVYESLGTIYYSYQKPGGDWEGQRKIGSGVSPTAVLDVNGLVHVAFRSQFLTNYDIMYQHMLPNHAWGLPIVLAKTSGASADPSLVADAAGKVYVAWADLTSGQWAIQLGSWDGRYWTTYPVTYGRGQSPSLAVLLSGSLFLAWQDRIPLAQNEWGKYDIFASQQADQGWTLPANVSDNASYSAGSNSIGVRATGAADGFAHMAWINDNTQVRYLFGRDGYWPVPVNIGQKRAQVRGLGLQSAADGLLYLALDEGESVKIVATSPRNERWPEPQLIATRTPPTGFASDVTLTASPDRVVISWVQSNGLGSTAIYESLHRTARPLLRLKVYAPILTNP